MAFLSGKKESPQELSGSSSANVINTVIGPSVHIVGEVKSQEDLLLEGSVEGRIEGSQIVTVGRSELAAALSPEEATTLAAVVHPPKPAALSAHALPGHTFRNWKLEDFEGKLDADAPHEVLLVIDLIDLRLYGGKENSKRCTQGFCHIVRIVEKLYCHMFSHAITPSRWYCWDRFQFH